MAKRERGLYRDRRSGIWKIDKVVKGRRIQESTGTTDLTKATRIITMRTSAVFEAENFGDIPEKTFREAARRYVCENFRKRAIRRESDSLDLIAPYIDHLPLSQVHQGTCDRFIRDRLAAGRKPNTVHRDLAPVRRVLILASRRWRDEVTGKPWLQQEPPLITVLELGDYEPRKPHVMTWEEQTRLLANLASHLADAALFQVNTGTRQAEVVALRWDWEIRGYPAFLIPRSFVKNKEDRLVVCNSIASRVVESQRGHHPTHVFTYKGQPFTRIYNSGWKAGRVRAGLPRLRDHDLKHTFGYRLRAAGVDEMDRKDLLGHKNGDISRHYSAPDLQRLLKAAEHVVGMRNDPALRLVGQ